MLENSISFDNRILIEAISFDYFRWIRLKIEFDYLRLVTSGYTLFFAEYLNTEASSTNSQIFGLTQQGIEPCKLVYCSDEISTFSLKVVVILNDFQLIF